MDVLRPSNELLRKKDILSMPIEDLPRVSIDLLPDFVRHLSLLPDQTITGRANALVSPARYGDFLNQTDDQLQLLAEGLQVSRTIQNFEAYYSDFRRFVSEFSQNKHPHILGRLTTAAMVQLAMRLPREFLRAGSNLYLESGLTAGTIPYVGDAIAKTITSTDQINEILQRLYLNRVGKNKVHDDSRRLSLRESGATIFHYLITGNIDRQLKPTSKTVVDDARSYMVGHPPTSAVALLQLERAIMKSL